MGPDRRTLVSISLLLGPRNCRRPVSRAAHATRRGLSKGRNGLSSPRALRLCYRLVPGEAALGTAAGGKLPLCGALCQKQAGFTVGVALRNSSVVHVWWDFQRMKRWASEILLWLIAATLKFGQKRREEKKERRATSVWLVDCR